MKDIIYVYYLLLIYSIRPTLTHSTAGCVGRKLSISLLSHSVLVHVQSVTLHCPHSGFTDGTNTTWNHETSLVPGARLASWPPSDRHVNPQHCGRWCGGGGSLMTSWLQRCLLETDQTKAWWCNTSVTKYNLILPFLSNITITLSTACCLTCWHFRTINITLISHHTMHTGLNTTYKYW